MITIVQDGPVRGLKAVGPRIDAMAAIAFKSDLKDAAMGGPDRIVLDLSDVDFVDSSGLGAIVAAAKLIAPDRRLELAALRPNVAKVFELTRMDRIFTIHQTYDPDAPADAA